MSSLIRYEPDPDRPGWMIWETLVGQRFNDLMGPVRVRAEGEGRARCRLFADERHSNLTGSLHGGATMGFIDIALFAAARTLGLEDIPGALTLDASIQFIGAGEVGEPLDAVIELLRETRGFMFLRGTLEQGDRKVAAFSATIRKTSRPA